MILNASVCDSRLHTFAVVCNDVGEIVCVKCVDGGGTCFCEPRCPEFETCPGTR